ncbi:MAG: hypothetical protein M0R80_17425 [Proteobacteria bacterium]|jgi:UDP-glucose 6-dehydrogenase|nr:hypothetical protein [Pseudomonadota bacterium]
MVKIYGMGWVGRAVRELFPDAMIHDPAQGLICEEKADVAFVCVPTPLKDGKLDTSIVEEVVKTAQEDLLIIRSTVNPGDCDRWEAMGKNIVFQPEYLGETPSHPLLNESQTRFMILGGKPENRRKVIELYTKVYNANITIRQVTNLEAEIIKLSENRAIAFKVMQCQELYDACELAGVDYYTIRDAVYGDDPRFNLWWTFIYDNRGFNSSKCLVKDVPAWCAWAESLGYDPTITNELVRRSNAYCNNSR